MSERPDLPQLPDDYGTSGETQRSYKWDDTSPSMPADTRRYPERSLPTANVPPPAPQSQRQQIRRYGQQEPVQHVEHVKKRGAARARRQSGLYLPLWSLALMLFFVLGITAFIVVLVVGLGGNQAPEKDPIIIVSSPIPTERPASFPISPATSTIPPEVDPNIADAGIIVPTVPLVLSGPTLEPIVFTPTPRTIAVGERVVVADVGTDQLNVRDRPGTIDSSVIFRAPEGTAFTIIEGPTQADGLTWWRIQDLNNTSLDGWAASNYLTIQTNQ